MDDLCTASGGETRDQTHFTLQCAGDDELRARVCVQAKFLEHHQLSAQCYRVGLNCFKFRGILHGFRSARVRGRYTCRGVYPVATLVVKTKNYRKKS